MVYSGLSIAGLPSVGVYCRVVYKDTNVGGATDTGACTGHVEHCLGFFCEAGL